VPLNLKQNKIGEMRQEVVFSLKYDEKLVACHSAQFFSLGHTKWDDTSGL
jgi:hypothetical protein